MIPYFKNEKVTLYHGDCREVLPKLTEKIDLVLTDPPYIMLDIEWDKKDIFSEAIDLIIPLLANSSAVVFWGRGDSAYGHNLEWARRGFKFSEEIIWDKRRVGSPMNAVPRSHEMVFVRTRNRSLNKCRVDFFDAVVIETAKIREELRRLRQGLVGKNKKEVLQYIDTLELKFKAPSPGRGLSRSQATPCVGREVAAVRFFMHGGRPKSIIADAPDHYRREHPTQKPTYITSVLARLASDPGATLLDPFAGSGTTGIAAIKTGRRAILIEAEEKYCEIIARRIQAETAQMELPFDCSKEGN